MRSGMRNPRPYVSPVSDAEIQAALAQAFPVEVDQTAETGSAEPVRAERMPDGEEVDRAPRAVAHGRSMPVRGPSR